MAKLNLNPGETIVGSGTMALHLKQGLGRNPFSGNIFVTNQRVCFKISMMPGDPDMNLALGDVKGFSVKKGLFTQVNIHSKSGETYPLTGFPAKKLQDWLRQVGVQEL